MNSVHSSRSRRLLGPKGLLESCLSFQPHNGSAFWTATKPWREQSRTREKRLCSQGDEEDTILEKQGKIELRLIRCAQGPQIFVWSRWSEQCVIPGHFFPAVSEPHCLGHLDIGYLSESTSSNHKCVPKCLHVFMKNILNLFLRQTGILRRQT